MRKYRHLIVAFFFLIIATNHGQASEPSVLESVDWLKPTDSVKTQKGGGLAGEVLPADEADPARLKLILKSETKCIARFKQPSIQANQYAIKGKIRYKNVTKAGYVELLNHTLTETYFSKTLGDHLGPMGKIEGDSAWRDFVTPMNLLGFPAPHMVELNVVLPGSGEVEIGSLELIDGQLTGSVSNAWWTDRTSGWMGAILGCLFGICGGLSGWLTGRGKGRLFVRTYYVATVAVGIASLFAGTYAIAIKQPYGVWYLLVLVGVIVPATSVAGFVTSSRRYAADELRRMDAHDSE